MYAESPIRHIGLPFEQPIINVYGSVGSVSVFRSVTVFGFGRFS